MNYFNWNCIVKSRKNN